MEKAFDTAAAMKLLSEGLLKANPANPDVPMWTVEDFDKEPRGLRYSRETWEKHPACQKAGMKWKRIYKNPLESFRGLTQDQIRERLQPKPIEEKVEVIDPKDFPTDETQ
tara:strand:- start:351 stop:680 length:330 start_codon:yes stop_codon:yes gene_type:complete